MIEIELKFHVDDEMSLQERLRELGADRVAIEHHVDTYFNHPCRDFAETREALRIRKVDGRPLVTYKGRKLPGEVKARRELEWALDGGCLVGDSNSGDHDGARMRELLIHLGFREVATVTKQRQLYRYRDEHGPLAITIDRVERLGLFGEVEVLADDETEVEAARTRVLAVGATLGFTNSEPRSYLQMQIEKESIEHG